MENNVVNLHRATVGFALTGSVATVQAMDRAGVSMPPVITAGTKTLQLNGMGVGTEKAIFKVYVVGLYLEEKTTNAKTAISSDEGKRISLTMLRDVSRQRFVQAVEKGMILNSGTAITSLRGRLNLLEKALPALKKGNRLDFTYLPGTGTLVRGQGQEMRIPGKDFADALISVWLGPKAANVALKLQLLGG